MVESAGSYAGASAAAASAAAVHGHSAARAPVHSGASAVMIPQSGARRTALPASPADQQQVQGVQGWRGTAATSIGGTHVPGHGSNADVAASRRDWTAVESLPAASSFLPGTVRHDHDPNFVARMDSVPLDGGSPRADRVADMQQHAASGRAADLMQPAVGSMPAAGGMRAANSPGGGAPFDVRVGSMPVSAGFGTRRLAG